MKISKKVLSILLVTIMAFLLVACNSSESPKNQNQASAPESKQELNFPKGPINFIVPFNPGGSSDLLARALAAVSKKYLNTDLVIINKPGGSCSIGLSELIESKPDGYTIGTANNGISQLPIMGNTPYVYPEKMTAICQIAAVPYVCVVRADSPYKNLKDLADAIKAKPNQLISATAGVGGGTHWEMEKLAMDLGSDIKSVPYNGGAPAIAALLGKGGTADVSVQAPTEVKEHIKAGTLRAIAVFGNERMKDPVFANVPTAKEQGYDIISPLWQGIGGPLNMDPSVVSYLEKGFQDSLKDPSVVKAIEDLGFEVSFMNSADFKAKWMREYEYYKKAFAELGDRLKI